MKFVVREVQDRLAEATRREREALIEGRLDDAREAAIERMSCLMEIDSASEISGDSGE